MSDSMKTNPKLEFDTETMREMGYRVVDMIVEHLGALPAKPASTCAPREELEARLREPAPQEGAHFESVLEQVRDDVLANAMWANHPRHFAWVPGPSNFVGVLGDAIASAYNICPSSWLEASGPSQVELIAVDWLRAWCGFPEEAGGIFVSGGSMANLTALATARRVVLGDDARGAVVYCSEQLHSSVVRNLRILGFSSEQIREVAVGEDLRLSLPALREAVRIDREAGLRPFCVIATAGTTNAGAVDPLPALSELCREQELWFHVDGAYGAAAVLSASGKRLLRGMEWADSLAVDPHKWLFQPFEIGCCLVRDGRWLAQTFSERPEYLQDTWVGRDAEREVNFGEHGVQLTRGFRALKLWMTVKVFGERSLRAAVQRGIDNAETVEACLREQGCFEIITRAQLGVVNFRYRVPGQGLEASNALTRAIYDANRERGFSMLTTTIIRGMQTLRICAINPRVEDAQLRRSVEILAEIGGALCGSAGRGRSEESA